MEQDSIETLHQKQTNVGIKRQFLSRRLNAVKFSGPKRGKTGWLTRFKTPKVSIATSRKMHVTSTVPYLAFFRTAAISATAPASHAASSVRNLPEDR